MSTFDIHKWAAMGAANATRRRWLKFVRIRNWTPRILVPRARGG